MLKRIRGLKISGISDDSRYVKKGDVFFAIAGSKFDGRQFIDEAVKKGAVAVVTDKGFKMRMPEVKLIRVANPRITLAQFASDFYGNPCRKFKVIGVTGTNGKTTVSYLLASILGKAGFEAGLIGTIYHKWKGNIIEAKNTTPGAIELQRLLSEMAADSVDYCVMEVSSHSLDQSRVFGIDFKTAIFTNITGEHLDYHKTFKGYLKAKSGLFSGLKRGSLAVLNLDDKSSEAVRKKTSAKVVTYGIGKEADVWADEIKSGAGKTEFLVRTKKGSFGVRSPLLGIFNVYNILAAVCAALNEKIPVEIIKKAISDFRGAEGRLELVDSEADFKIFVDYAHTDNALENVLGTLKKVARKRLIVVFGCGGDRDRFKRPRMGNVASRYADYAVITSDNPRNEDPLAIAKEAEKGIAKNFKAYKIIVDRFEAIREAIKIARAGDIVLIAGKGHERYQIIGDKSLPFSDKEAVREILSEKASEGICLG